LLGQLGFVHDEVQHVVQSFVQLSLGNSDIDQSTATTVEAAVDIAVSLPRVPSLLPLPLPHVPSLVLYVRVPQCNCNTSLVDERVVCLRDLGLARRAQLQDLEQASTSIAMSQWELLCCNCNNDHTTNCFAALCTNMHTSYAAAVNGTALLQTSNVYNDVATRIAIARTWTTVATNIVMLQPQSPSPPTRLDVTTKQLHVFGWTWVPTNSSCNLASQPATL
jgi:hypothetical protein